MTGTSHTGYSSRQLECPLCASAIRPCNLKRHLAACERNRAAATQALSPGWGAGNSEAQGVPLRPGNGRWVTSDGPDRLSPRSLVEAARGDLDKAWGTADYFAAVIHVRGAVDWLRRALEQMVPVDAEDQKHQPEVER